MHPLARHIPQPRTNAHAILKRREVRDRHRRALVLTYVDDLVQQSVLCGEALEGRLQRALQGPQAGEDVEAGGVVCDDVVGEDEGEGGEVLAVEGEGVVGEGVVDLEDGGGVLGRVQGA